MTGALTMASEAAAQARQWWPADWADEVMPPGLASPDAFIHPLPLDDRMSFMLRYDDGEPEAENEFYRLAVSPGDIVPFLCCDDLGDVEVTIKADGSFETHGDVPERASHFCLLGDPDSLAYSMKEFAAQYAAGLDPGALARFSVGMAWWSEPLPHKLIVEDGKARFAAVSAGEARQ